MTISLQTDIDLLAMRILLHVIDVQNFQCHVVKGFLLVITNSSYTGT